MSARSSYEGMDYSHISISPSNSSNELTNNLKDTEILLERLQKENFELKTRLFYYQSNSVSTESQTIIDENVKMKMEMADLRKDLEEKSQLAMKLGDQFQKQKSKYDKKCESENKLKEALRKCVCKGGTIPLQQDYSVPIVHQVVKEVNPSAGGNTTTSTNNTHVKEVIKEIQVPVVKEIIKEVPSVEYEKLVDKYLLERKMVESDRDSLQNQLNEHKLLVKKMEFALKQSQDTIDQMREQEKHLNRNNNDLIGQINALQTQLNEMMLSSTSANSMSSTNQQQLQQLQQKINLLQKQIEQWKANFGNLHAQYEQLKTLSESLKSQNEVLRNENEGLMSKNMQIESALQDQFVELQNAQQSYQNSLIQLQKEYDRQGNIRCDEITALREKIKKMRDDHFYSLVDQEQSVSAHQMNYQFQVEELTAQVNDLLGRLDDKERLVVSMGEALARLENSYHQIADSSVKSINQHNERITHLLEEGSILKEQFEELEEKYKYQIIQNGELINLNTDLDSKKNQLEGQVASYVQLLKERETKYKSELKEMEKRAHTMDNKSVDLANQFKFKFSQTFYQFVQLVSSQFNIGFDGWDLQYIVNHTDNLSDLFAMVQKKLSLAINEERQQILQEQQELQSLHQSNTSSSSQQTLELRDKVSKLYEEMQKLKASKQEEIQMRDVQLKKMNDELTLLSNHAQQRENKIKQLKNNQQIQTNQMNHLNQLLEKSNQQLQAKDQYHQQQLVEHQQKIDQQAHQLQEEKTLLNQDKRNYLVSLKSDFSKVLDERNKLIKAIQSKDNEIKSLKEHQPPIQHPHKHPHEKQPRLSKLPSEINPDEHIELIENIIENGKQTISTTQKMKNVFTDFAKFKEQNKLLFLELQDRTKKYNNVVNQFKEYNNRVKSKMNQQQQPIQQTTSTRNQHHPPPSPIRNHQQQLNSVYIPDLQKNQIHERSVYISENPRTIFTPPSSENDNTITTLPYRDVTEEAQHSLKNIKNTLKYIEKNI